MSSTPPTTKKPHFKPQEQPKPEKIVQNIPNRRLMKKAGKKITTKSPSAFRTISEVAGELKVQQHVLRFWESKFSQIKPLKRGGGRRYYRPEDVELLKNIYHLLYQEGYTIKGVQKLLHSTRGNLSARVSEVSTDIAKPSVSQTVSQNKDELQEMLIALKSMRNLIG